MSFQACAAAGEVAAVVAGRHAEIEAARRLPDDVAAVLATSGLLRMLTPAAYGGHELHPRPFFDAIERIAQADASVAWCAFIACNSCLISAWLDPAVAAPIFGRPELKAAGVFAPRGRARREGDGYRVNGRWPWGSFAHHADVLSAGCVVIGGDGQPEAASAGTAPRTIAVLLDKAQVRVLDNWASMGLKGSGSGEFEVVEAFVPASRSTNLGGGTPAMLRPLYRFPIFGLLALSIAAVASGIARLAIESLIDLSGAKVPQGASRPLAMRAATQDAVARCDASLRAARAFLFETVDTAWRQAEREDGVALEARRDLRMASTHLVLAAAAAVDRMYALGGGSSVFETSPLQRCLRDVRVATQHLMVGEATFELAGRLLLGVPTDTAQL